MIKQFLLIALFVSLAAVCNSVMDKLQFHYEDSVFSDLSEQYWNPEKSWLNKYKDPENKDFRPKFFGSTTFLVFLTDGWHLAQFMFLNFFALACVPIQKKFYKYVLVFLGIRTMFGLTFTLFFDKIL